MVIAESLPWVSSEPRRATPSGVKNESFCGVIRLVDSFSWLLLRLPMSHPAVARSASLSNENDAPISSRRRAEEGAVQLAPAALRGDLDLAVEVVAVGGQERLEAPGEPVFRRAGLRC